MDVQWQNGTSAVPGNQLGSQSWTGINAASTDYNHKIHQASSVGHGHEGKQEWISSFDDFYSDVFLNDFENVDMAKYNVVCPPGMRGGLCSFPNNHSSTTSVYSSVTIPSIYSSWNHQPTSNPNFTTVNAGCVAAAETYLQWGLGHVTCEHFPTGTCGYPHGCLQTTDGELERADMQSLGGEHPQECPQATSGEHQQGHMQTVGGEHPQHMCSDGGEHPKNMHLVGEEHLQEYLQADGEEQQGHMQPRDGEHPQGHVQPRDGEHPQGHVQPRDMEHPQGHVQPRDWEHPQGHVQPRDWEHPQGHVQPRDGEHPQGHVQPRDGEHPQGHVQPRDGEHPQGQLETAQQLLVGAPQETVEENCVFTRVRKRNQGTQNLQNEDFTFLSKSLSKPCSGTQDVGITLPSASNSFNNIDRMSESTESFQLHSAESDGSVGHVTSSEDRGQTTASTYGSISSVKSSPTLGPTSSDHVSSSSDSRDSSKHARVREVRRAVDEPRRPKNGFIRFSIEHRQQIAVKHPKLDNREISRMLGCKWRKLSNEEKKPYEEEFEKDIQAIREVNPEWRYAPARQLVEELIEPMPSRLRPRNSLKRKKLPSLVRTYSRRHNKSSKNSKKPSPAVHTQMLDPPATPEDTSTTWVQCDLCGKWRCLPSFIPPEKLCDIWFCYFNPDKRYNSCSIKEELDPEDPADPPHLPSLPSPPARTTQTVVPVWPPRPTW